MRASGTIYKDMFFPRINEFESHDASLCLVFVLPDLLKTSFTTSNLFLILFRSDPKHRKKT